MCVEPSGIVGPRPSPPGMAPYLWLDVAVGPYSPSSLSAPIRVLNACFTSSLNSESVKAVRATSSTADGPSFASMRPVSVSWTPFKMAASTNLPTTPLVMSAATARTCSSTSASVRGLMALPGSVPASASASVANAVAPPEPPEPALLDGGREMSISLSATA